MIRVGCGVDVLADPGNNPRATTICLFVIGSNVQSIFLQIVDYVNKFDQFLFKTIF